MTKDGKNSDIEVAASLVDPRHASTIADRYLSSFLDPKKWTDVHAAIARFNLAQTQLQTITWFRKAMVDVALHRLRVEDLVGEWAEAPRFPPGPATTQLIDELLRRRRDFFRRLGKAEPSLWHPEIIGEIESQVETEIYTSEEEEAAICSAIDLVVKYAWGGETWIGEYDPEVKLVMSVIQRVRITITNGLAAIEKARAGAVAQGRIAMSCYGADWGLRAATTGLDMPPAPKRDRDKEIVGVVSGMERVKPPIARKLIAEWITEVGLAKHSERSINVLINRLRRGKKARLPLRKKHTTTE